MPETIAETVSDFLYLGRLTFFLEPVRPETAAKLVADAYEEATGRKIVDYKKTRKVDGTTNAQLIEIAGNNGVPTTAIEVHYRGICREMRATKYYHIYLGTHDSWDKELTGRLETSITSLWEASRNGKEHI